MLTSSAGGINDTNGQPSRTYHFTKQYITDHRINHTVRTGTVIKEVLVDAELDRHFGAALKSHYLQQRLQIALNRDLRSL